MNSNNVYESISEFIKKKVKELSDIKAKDLIDILNSQTNESNNYEKEEKYLESVLKEIKKRFPLSNKIEESDIKMMFIYYIHIYKFKKSEKYKNDLRKLQKRAIHNLSKFIANGKLEGYISMPTGTGKTRTFINTIQALDIQSIVLVPNSNLVDQTAQEYEKMGGTDCIILGGESEDSNGDAIEKLYNKLKSENSKNVKLIVTYNSYRNLVDYLLESKDKDDEKYKIIKRFFDGIGLVISDEAHNSIENKSSAKTDFLTGHVKKNTITKFLSEMLEDKFNKDQLLLELNNDDIKSLKETLELGLINFDNEINDNLSLYNLKNVDEMKEKFEIFFERYVTSWLEEIKKNKETNQVQKYEKVAEYIQKIKTDLIFMLKMRGKKQKIMHIQFTATPARSNKELQEENLIFEYNLDQAYKDNVLVKPSKKETAIAYHKSLLKEKDIVEDEDGENGTYFNESGEPIYQEQVDLYSKLLEENAGYCPGMIFAANINHAKNIKKYIDNNHENIRSRIFVSDSETKSDELKQSWNEGKLDIAITVRKGAEGFDYKPLKCGILSTAKTQENDPVLAVQAPGRIRRSFNMEYNKEEIENIYKNWGERIKENMKNSEKENKSEKKLKDYIINKYIVKKSDNTYMIEPESFNMPPISKTTKKIDINVLKQKYINPWENVSKDFKKLMEKGPISLISTNNKDFNKIHSILNDSPLSKIYVDHQHTMLSYLYDMIIEIKEKGNVKPSDTSLYLDNKLAENLKKLKFGDQEFVENKDTRLQMQNRTKSLTQTKTFERLKTYLENLKNKNTKESLDHNFLNDYNIVAKIWTNIIARSLLGSFGSIQSESVSGGINEKSINKILDSWLRNNYSDDELKKIKNLKYSQEDISLLINLIDLMSGISQNMMNAVNRMNIYNEEKYKTYGENPIKKLEFVLDGMALKQNLVA